MSLHVYRQGDVLFIPVLKQDLPAQRRTLKARLIRRGEHGGRHEIEVGGAATQTESETPRRNGTSRRRFLHVLAGPVVGAFAGVGIVHGEHNRLALPAREPSLPEHEGDYEVRIQRELQGKVTRFVAD